MRERKTVGYTVRLSPTEAEAVRRAAETAGMSVSDWFRVLGVEGAVQRLKDRNDTLPVRHAS